MDRVRVEPTTSASMACLLSKGTAMERIQLFKSHPLHFELLKVAPCWVSRITQLFHSFTLPLTQASRHSVSSIIEKAVVFVHT
jgi:hypothetical protein